MLILSSKINQHYQDDDLRQRKPRWPCSSSFDQHYYEPQATAVLGIPNLIARVKIVFTIVVFTSSSKHFESVGALKTCLVELPE
ncbi:hypothetical protein T10_7104 [Trichinella papuae]|uniref:Uncharacterized protein n=1 Tax=Trichinella papuae TaxID=268474 RepID=A0A0V1NAJ3_9BILA|nr:hypothetical protein T10_7104 [Trichinella papuae]